MLVIGLPHRPVSTLMNASSLHNPNQPSRPPSILNSFKRAQICAFVVRNTVETSSYGEKASKPLFTPTALFESWPETLYQGMSFNFELESSINLGEQKRERERDSSQWHNIIYWEKLYLHGRRNISMTINYFYWIGYNLSFFSGLSK